MQKASLLAWLLVVKVNLRLIKDSTFVILSKFGDRFSRTQNWLTISKTLLPSERNRATGISLVILLNSSAVTFKIFLRLFLHITKVKPQLWEGINNHENASLSVILFLLEFLTRRHHYKWAPCS